MEMSCVRSVGGYDRSERRNYPRVLHIPHSPTPLPTEPSLRTAPGDLPRGIAFTLHFVLFAPNLRSATLVYSQQLASLLQLAQSRAILYRVTHLIPPSS